MLQQVRSAFEFIIKYGLMTVMGLAVLFLLAGYVMTALKLMLIVLVSSMIAQFIVRPPKNSTTSPSVFSGQIYIPEFWCYVA